MKLFSKLKDYNSELEEILDKKVFSSNIKSLLLSMIYKIEICYKDFKEVKRTVRKQDEFLYEIIETIKIYCDNIKSVEPDKKDSELLKNNKVLALTNEKERSILCYATELSLLFAVSDISPKYFYISKDFILKNHLQSILVDGYNLNNLELLRNFNGWSWDITQKENFNYVNNTIYQNLLFILGDKFLTEWRTHSSVRREFLEEVKMYIKSFTGTNKFFNTLCSIVYKTSKGREHQKVESFLIEKSKELKKMQDNAKYLEDAKKRKLKLTKLVEKLDIVINDKSLLVKEYEKTNKKLEEDKKIGSIRIYENMLQKEREKYLNEINEISSLLKPINFLKKKQELESYYEILKNKNSIEDEIIELEKEFIIFLNKKLNKLESRDEIVDLLYELRYIKNIYIKKDTLISDVEILNNAIDKIMKKAITKACKMGVMKIISMDIALNYEIIKYALDTKIINLEEIRLNFEKQENNLIIKVFDKEVFEKQGKKKISNLDNNILEVKYKRNIKLFN